MPIQSALFPSFIPLHFSAGAHEELHFHLFELTHAEDELTRHDFISKGLTYLCNTKWDFHAAGFLHVEVIQENSLSGLRAQVQRSRILGNRTQLCAEHKVELAYIGPIHRSTHWTLDFLVLDQLLYICEIFRFHRFHESVHDGSDLVLVAHHARVGAQVLLLIEALAKSLFSLFDFLLYLLSNLLYMVLDQHIRAVALLTVFVVDQRIIKSIHVTRSLPSRWVHENRRINTNNIFVHLHHCTPPIGLDVVL